MNIIQAPDDLMERWEAFVKQCAPDGGFLQSWRWGDFQKSLGNKIFRLAIVDGTGELRAVCLLVKEELPFEYNYLYAPRGPVVTSITSGDDLQRLFNEIKVIGREEKSFMIKVDPPWLVGNESRLTAVGFRKSEYEIQPKCGFVIPITADEAVLLNQMKPKTRYNIGLAVRHGVQIRISHELPSLEVFWQLMKQTAKRDSFQSHLKEHYKKLLETFSFDQTVQLFLAEYDRKIVSAAFIGFYGDVATYLHGASADLYREVMAPYLVQWQAIQEARQFGCHAYDFGGVNGQSYQNKKWEGITRFKTGFGQSIEPREYVGAFELILKPAVFAAYKFVKQIRT